MKRLAERAMWPFRWLGERLGFPPGAVATVIAGLALTGGIALLPDAEEGGEFLDWITEEELPDSRPVGLGGGTTMQIVDAGISSTRFNGSGYRLYRVDGTLRFDGRPPRRVECAVIAPGDALLAKSGTADGEERRASYPRPTEGEDLTEQNVPGAVAIHFNAKGADIIAVELDDAVPEYTSAAGVVAEWIEYEKGRQAWEWQLPRDVEELDVSFAAFWRTTAEPAGEIVCETGKSRTGTEASLTPAELEAAEEGEEEI